MKISVIMPIYNSEKHLAATLASVLGQKDVELEIIAIDDFSLDSSAECLRKIASEDSRIKPFFNECNIGVAATRNLALGIATGDYIAFCDSDDIVPDGAYAALLASMGDADIVAGSYDKIYDNGQVDVFTQITPASALSSFSVVFSISSLCNKLVKRDFLIRSGVSFDEKMKIGEDVIFLAELVSRKPICAATDTIVYHYYQRNKSENSSLTHAYNLEMFAQHVECKERLLSICEGVSEAENYVYIQSTPYLTGILCMIPDNEDRTKSFDIYKKFLRGYDFSKVPALFFSLTGVPFDGFFDLSAGEFFEIKNFIPKREVVLAEFQSGSIGLRWIIKYSVSWLKYKFSRKK